MSAPSNLSWKAFSRVAHYLFGRPRLVYVHRRQEVEAIAAYVGTDWAGCTRKMKSASGGAMMLGGTRSSIGRLHSPV